jgi:hypothetical protein
MPAAPISHHGSDFSDQLCSAVIGLALAARPR